jgi:triphosphoribosyl-dephospho-CoA synthase
MSTALLDAPRACSRALAVRHAEPARRRYCAWVARLAVRSLYDELSLYPKPGLVSMIDSGSHDDMDAATFMRSLFSLRHYFARITAAGMDGAPFHRLKRLGVAAEERMLEATGGINTHRGAVFCLGMLCAAAGWTRAQRRPLTLDAIRASLLDRWGRALGAHAAQTGASHGLAVAAQHGASGAREEAALGLPSVFELALPIMTRVQASVGCWNRARIEALFALMAHVSDTNVYYRGGASGADLVRTMARRFLERGGTAHAGWLYYALACHDVFSRRRLSPGGAADLLAATCLLHRLTSGAETGYA